MLRFFSTTALAIAGLFGQVNAQCPNLVAAANPNLRTMTANSTWLVLPVPKAAVQTAVNEAYPQAQLNPLTKLTLLDVPSSALPADFPPDHHPVWVNIGLQADIRMTVLQIDGDLIQASAYAPWVAKGGSKTPLNAALSILIGGTDDQVLRQLAALIPAGVATLVEGSTTKLGNFEPGSAAYQSNGAGLYSALSKWIVVPNPLTGPGVFIEAYDFSFVTASAPKYTLKQLKAMINQPFLLNGLTTGFCARNTYYFNNATAQPVFRTGNVTVGPAGSGFGLTQGTLRLASPDKLGNYYGVDGVSACAQAVGNNPEDCDTAAMNLDPAAL